MELTKEYFDQKFATFATKDDLKALQADIKDLPTKKDVEAIVKAIVGSIVDGAVGELAAITNNGFTDVMERFDNVNERFDKVDARFDGVDERIDRVENRLDNVEEKLDQVDVRGRVRVLETDMRKIKTAIHLK